MSPEMLAALANIPAMAPPPGIVPNFVDPPSKGQDLLVLNTIFLPLMLIAVTMRLIVKGRIVHQFGWDDTTCAIAAISSVIHSAFLIESVHVAIGKHLWDIRAATLVNVGNLRLLDANQVAYPVATYFIKLSILMLYLRLFSISRAQRWGSLIGIILITVTHVPFLGFMIYLTVNCAKQAVEEVTSLSPFILDTVCKNIYWICTIQSAINVLTDFYILLLPLPALLKLAIPTRKKVGLTAIFLAGLVACVVSVVRLVLLTRTIKLSDANKGDDYTWNSTTTMELSTVEVNIAIICACMTTLPPFLTHFKSVGSEIYSSLRSRIGGSSSQKREIGGSSHSKLSGSDQTSLSPLSPISISKSYIVSCAPIENDKNHGNLGNTYDVRGKGMW